MDRALNKSTDKLISAFEVHKNGAYQNLTKGEWIAPKDSISNWEEISEEDSFVHYTREKEYQNWKGTWVLCSPHFAKYPGSNAKTVEESPQHKMFKNWLFDKLKKDDLEIVYSSATKKYKYENSSRLSELDIDWNNYAIEVPIRSKKNLRADILLPLKSKHELLGFGIVIEIQISKQNKKDTYERSIDRAINGYSTIWLFENDFELNDSGTEIELKNNKLKVFSFSSELKHSGKRFARELKLVVEEQCRYLDIKKEELIKKTEEIEEYKEEFIGDAKKSINGFFSYKIKELSQNFNEEIARKVQDNFFINHKKEVSSMVYDFTKEIVEDKLIIKVTEELDMENIKEEAKKIIYNKINDYFIYKEVISNPPNCCGCKTPLILSDGNYGLWWKCPNYPVCKVKNSHTIPEEIKRLFESGKTI